MTTVVTIDGLAAGGDGVGRDAEGRVVFVPGSAPGDRVRVRIERQRRRHAHAELVEVLDAGPGRVVPRCDRFGSCGGCSWQHLDAAVQLEAKAAIVRDALVRIGGFALESPPEIHASPRAYGYRARTRVRVEGGRVGYRRRRSRALCATDHCPVLVPELEAELARLAAAPPRRDGEWELASAGGATRAVELARPEGPSLELEVAGERVAASPTVFFQANAPLRGRLAERVLDRAGQGAEAIELHAGAGLFTLPLARRFDALLAVEGAAAAASDLRSNLEAAGLPGVRVRHAPVDATLGELAGAGPDLLLLDPPRTGLPPGGASALADVGARRIVYVSCDPATLARDLATLREARYRLVGIEAFDLFPQTPHVEVLAVLERADGDQASIRP